MNFALKTTMVIAIAAAMSVPAATAEWYAFGSYEPDTPYDAGWMFADPPGIGESKIYFNGFPTTSYNGNQPVNPNVGALNTQIEPTNVEYQFAMLGVWKDCNGDGYVGLAETAVREYAAQLLTNTEACPPANGAANTWAAGAHNYNGWVTELIPIVRTNMQNLDRRTYFDEDARVWADFHRPDERPYQRSCALSPQPRGTYHNTGGVMNYAECRFEQNGVNGLGTFNAAMALIGDPLGLSFSNDDDARSGTLGQIPLGGDENNENAAIRTSDCDADPALRVHSGDTANQTPLGPSVPAAAQNTSRTIYSVSPSTGDLSSPTIAGQLNQTMEERNGDCNFENDFGHDLYNGVCVVLCVAETDFQGVNPNNKTQANWNFNSSGVQRGAQPYAATGPVTRWNGFTGPASDHGIGPGTAWIGGVTTLSKAAPRTVKLDLENGGADLAPAYWLTYYAHVGQATRDRSLALPSSGSGTYGSWHCGGNDSGIHNGWNCDADIWYINPDGTFPIASTLALAAKPGWSYELRDVDCFDGGINALGVGVEPAFYGPEPCP